VSTKITERMIVYGTKHYKQADKYYTVGVEPTGGCHGNGIMPPHGSARNQAGRAFGSESREEASHCRFRIAALFVRGIAAEGNGGVE
jgi:hypothetical protein